MIRIYGIKNCDSVRKAVRFFRTHGFVYETIDFREHPLDEATLQRWLEKGARIGDLFNSRSTAYRTHNLKAFAPLDEETRRTWLLRENLLIKRPVVETPDTLLVGYDESLYKERFL